MAKKKGEKRPKPKTLDDLLGGLREEHSKNLDESFKAWDAFSKEENQNHLYNNIFMPAQQALYNGIVQELDKIFKDDDASVHGKEKEVKKAVTAGLKKYFEKAQPVVTKTMDALNMDEDEQYEHLTRMYDRHVGADGENIPTIRALTSITKNRKGKVHQVKSLIPKITEKHIEGAANALTRTYQQHHFSKYHGAEIAGYLKPQLEKAGFEVENKLGYATADLDDFLKLRQNILEKKGHKYLEKAEEKKK